MHLTNISKNPRQKKACISAGFSLSGSTTWTRTRDPMINSHLLYQLSYRGMRRMLLIKKKKSSIEEHFDEFLQITAAARYTGLAISLAISLARSSHARAAGGRCALARQARAICQSVWGSSNAIKAIPAC